MLLTPRVNYASIFNYYMPGRKTPLVNNEIYHVFNKGVASAPTFLNKREYGRAIETIRYYQNITPSLKYARFLRLSAKERLKILDKFKSRKDWLVEIVCFCFMPNHFHFLLKQLTDGGISKFMSNFTNSYTRYFNTKHERNGPLFTGKFRSVRIETEEQLVHVSRYVHLNPYASYVVKTAKDLEEYPYSSFPEYIGKTAVNLCSRDIILSHFKDTESYKNFVFDSADYQRELNKIKHLLQE